MKRLPLLAAALVVAVGVALAKGTAQNIAVRKHPNLAAAQRMCAQAYDKMVAAQRANEYDLEGHAQKAKDLLDQVNSELKLAAEVSNESAAPH